tara:strand:- start:955 stop:1614 length:660 start_codon:yes stop_codon:yes gene_type:complete
MNEIAKLKNVHPLVKSDLQKQLAKLQPELDEGLVKRQYWRTPTEARFSVLNDASFPTNASKYWQCVREQAVHYTELIRLSFSHRRNEVKIKRIKHKLRHLETDDQFGLMDLEIDLDECLYVRESFKMQGENRVKELQIWSDIMKELTDAEDFDTENVDTHQAQSYLLTLDNRRKTLSPNSTQPEIMNVLGPLNTLRRLLGLDELSLEKTMKEIKNGTGE